MMRRQARQRGWTGVVLLMTLVSGILSTGAGEAATYYVATSGSSGCSTNRSSPSASVSNSLGCLRPGDTLYFLAGTYNCGTCLNNPPSGNSGARITIAGDPQDGTRKVQLNIGDGSSNGISISGSSYLTFDNLVFDASSAAFAGFKIQGGSGSNFITLQNSEIRNACQSAILVGGDGHQFINLHVHHNGSTELDHGFYITGADNLVQGCDIHDNFGYGIQLYNGSNSRAVNNATIRQNRIHNNTAGNRSTNSVVLGSGDNIQFYNNLVYNAPHEGIQLGNGGTNTKVYNNTIYGHSTNCISVNDGGGAVLRNNICFSNGNNAVVGSTNATVSNNLFSDPKFVNGSSEDFHLQASSPAIKAGVDLSSVFTTDFAGLTRPPGNFDLGAYAVGGTGGGSGGQTPLPAPRNLRLVTSP